MKKQLLTIAMLASSLIVFAQTNGFATPTPQTARIGQSQAKAPLGDLSKFRVIADDSLKIAKTGNLKASEKRITDMESAWNVSANKLKKLNTVSWRKLDLALDRVLFELRADKPDKALCVKALEDMLAVIDSLK